MKFEEIFATRRDMARNSLVLKIGLIFLIVIPGLVVFRYCYRIHRYHALLERYECNRDPCEADFDGDGILGTLSVDRAAPVQDFDSWLVVRDSGRELLREPRRSIDNSLKTHAAIVYDGHPARLLIYDHIFDHNPTRSLVFAYDGKTITQRAPSKIDNEVLAAMGAADETGTSERWILFQLLAVPTLVGYYALLIFAAWKSLWKRT